uniref:SusC/RagA family TonB-linked outer membrane protein n=1 Tax=Roseihalotalea indica TaxID=2867963 RepID=A0AA49GIX5_9BACT|nr:SusC/RagA family TonB-linked outer membrane protein [Tunicatimonas sp. TK19036]
MSKFTLYAFTLQCIFASVLLASPGKSQSVSVEEVYLSIQVKDTRLEDAFAQIENKTNFTFSFNKGVINTNRRISADLRNKSLGYVLRYISKEAGLSFLRINENIYVNKRKAQNSAVMEQLDEELSLADHAVEGVVRALDDDSALPGVNILIKGTTRGTTTDVEGKYRINVPEDAVLIFSYLGYLTEEVEVGDQTTINVSMAPDVSSLSEVVVVGYGAQSKRELTSAITSIDAEQIKEMPVVGIDQSIQGRAPGVVVINNTGEPGGGITMRIRGTTSIGSGSDPLFVVDGVPIDNAQTSNVNVGQARVNGISQINPSDIESIEILKDAAATAIYGARASNGVVLITTKRGEEGVSEISFDAYTGLSQVTSRYDVLGASDFATLANEGMAQIDEPPVYSQDFINNPTTDTDWQDELFRTAHIYNANLSARGGNKTTGYMISGGYLNQEGTIVDTRFQRYSLRANVDHKVNDFVKLGITFFTSYTDQDRVKNDGSPDSGDASNYNHIYGTPALSTALVKSPTVPVLASNGYYSIDPLQGSFGNPVRQALDISINNNVRRTLPSVFANISFTDNLMLTSRFSADIRSENEEWFNPPNPNQLEGTSDGEGQTSRRTYDLLLWTLDNYLTYDLEVGSESSFTALVGTSSQRSQFERSFVLVSGLETANIPTFNAGTEFDVVDSEMQAWSLASFFTRLNYTLKGRYLFNVNARYDGSSRFGKNNRFGFFPSAAVGWRISDEPFMQDVAPISDLKIRASYGVTGNQEIGNYASRALLNLGGGTNFGNNYTGSTGATFASLASNDLTWEETTQLDIGLDASLLNDRLSITTDYYIKTTDKLLFQVPLPLQSGFANIQDNVGKLENRGFEFSFNSVNIRNNDFYWTTNFNIATNQNKILELLDDEDVLVGSNTTGYSIARVGEEISFYLYEREKYVNPETGILELVDQNGDEAINEDDLVIAGSPFPDFFGGITNYVSYKNFDMSVFFQYSYGNKVYNLTRRYMELMNVGGRNVISANTTQKAFDNRWQNPGDVTEYPRPNYDQENNDYNLSHDGWLEDGSYLRLKTLTLGYNLGESVAERIGFNRARVYFTTNNLLTFTKYTGYDPEVDHFTGANGGQNSGLRKGYDNGTYPQAKSYVIGVSLSF